MTYYDIIKNSTITNVDNIERLHKEDIELLKSTKPKKHSLLWGLLSILAVDTNSDVVRSCLRGEYINNPHVYQVGNYIVDSIGWEEIFLLHRGSLVAAIITRIMDKLNVKNPFEILLYDIQEINLEDIIEELVYSNGGEFYGVYCDSYMIPYCLIEDKNIIIHKFRIEVNKIKDAISTMNYTFSYHLGLETPGIHQSLFILKHEKGGLIESNGEKRGWIFFLTKEQLEEFIKREEWQAYRKIQESLPYYMDGDNIYKRGIKSVKKDLRLIKKELKTRKTLISV